MKARALVVAFLLAAPGRLVSQNVAPREEVESTVAGRRVAIEYGRPSLDGRSLKELLESLPADRMWRAGSEQVTTLVTELDLLVGDARIPAGKYSLYVHCGERGERELAINRDLGQPLGKIAPQAPAQLKDEPWPHFNYEKEIGHQEVARIPLSSASTDQSENRFTIRMNPSGDRVELTLSWGPESWSVFLSPAP